MNGPEPRGAPTCCFSAELMLTLVLANTSCALCRCSGLTIVRAYVRYTVRTVLLQHILHNVFHVYITLFKSFTVYSPLSYSTSFIQYIHALFIYHFQYTLYSYISMGLPLPPSPLQVVYEVPSTSQWCFDVQWCPRNPGLISTSSFDGHISVYSLLGGAGGEGEGKEVRGEGGRGEVGDEGKKKEGGGGAEGRGGEGMGHGCVGGGGGWVERKGKCVLLRSSGKSVSAVM